MMCTCPRTPIHPFHLALLFAFVLLMPMALGLVPARAGDAAEFRSHGFSADEKGRYFAFEEFGVQDGSGFPYSNIYIIDLEKDAWVPNMPVRVLLKDEGQSTLAARVKAFAAATPVMQEYGISRSGVLMAASPVNAPGNKAVLEFRQLINPLLGKQAEPYRLELGTIDVMDQNDCGMQDGRVMGFTLSLIKPDGSFVGLHDEGEAPKSRGCPVRYDLIAAFAPGRYRSQTYGAALIGVYSRGFEGEDLRYIAVPFEF